MNYLPTCTSRFVVQHPCQVSFKSMQGCRRSWEDKLKCVKILSVKDHNSAKICRTLIISPHALLDLWCNIPAKFHSNPCKDVGGVEKTNFDGTEWRNDGRTVSMISPISHPVVVSVDSISLRYRRYRFHIWYWTCTCIRRTNGAWSLV